MGDAGMVHALVIGGVPGMGMHVDTVRRVVHESNARAGGRKHGACGSTNELGDLIEAKKNTSLKRALPVVYVPVKRLKA